MDKAHMNGEGERCFMHEVPGMYEYNGMLMLGQFPACHLDQIQELPLSEEDVIIAGYPRSGTVWIQEALWLLYHNADTDLARSIPLLKRFPALEHQFLPGNPAGIVNSLESARTTPPPHLMKTRLPASFFRMQVESGNTKAIAILRNPKDVLVSQFNFYRMNRGYKFDKSWDYFFDMFRAKHLFWGDWFDHVLSWWSLKDQSNVHIVFYEDMKRNLRAEVTKMAAFTGRHVTEDQLDKITEHCQFESMRDNPATNFSVARYIYDFSKAPFMRSGTVGGWKDYFTQEQSDFIDQMCQERLHPYGLHFRFEL